jgi:hypothetical protein
MNNRKLQHLFEQARKERPPVPSEDFQQNVIRALKANGCRDAVNLSVWDQLGQMFPKLAIATLLIIGICIVVDFYGSNTASLASEVSRLSDQWFFDSGEI